MGFLGVILENSYYLIRISIALSYPVILDISMPPLRLRFKKKNDGQAVFTAVRGDGSSTSTNLGSARGFGPVHDLAHYVVETALGIHGGFLGLLAAGRNIEDFDHEAKVWLTEDAYAAEAIAGQLSQDVGTAVPLSVEDFNWTVRDSLTRGPVAHSAPELSAGQLTELRVRLDELIRQWRGLGDGETLELDVAHPTE